MDTFRVYTRCRPLNEYEQTEGASRKSVVIIDQCTLTLKDGISKEHTFQLDGVFDEHIDNLHIFNEAIVPALENVANGVNSTIFAYGITGAGKSFTMFGKSPTSNQPVLAEHRGLIPLTFDYFFSIMDPTTTKLRMSYIQIYNEQVFDLLQETQHSLQLSEDPIQGCVIVQDLIQVELQTENHVEQLVSLGNSRRVIAETKANEVSSRSHAIVIVNLERKIDEDRYLTAKLSLVDLAGSERQSVHSETKGIRTFEGSNINRSLLTLGNCINILSEKKKQASGVSTQFIPYRDSKLTRLLKDSLGGNTKTVMISCISPSSLCYQETVNTMKYACRANKIEKIVHQNIKQTKSYEEYKKQIASLKKENQMLKMNLNMSLMLPQLTAGMAQQESKCKKARVIDILDQLVKNVEERVILMSMSGETKMESMETLVRIEEQLKSNILNEFDLKIRKGAHKNDSVGAIQGKKASKDGPTPIRDATNHKTTQKQKSIAAMANQNPINSKIQAKERAGEQHHDIAAQTESKKNKLINLENLRKKVMEDKKQLSNFKTQIMQRRLTEEEIQLKASGLLSMAKMSALRFNAEEIDYLTRLSNGDIQTIVKENFESTKRKILNLGSYSDNQQHSMMLDISEVRGVENSRSRHLKTLDRIMSLGRGHFISGQQFPQGEDNIGSESSHCISNGSMREDYSRVCIDSPQYEEEQQQQYQYSEQVYQYQSNKDYLVREGREDGGFMYDIPISSHYF